MRDAPPATLPSIVREAELRGRANQVCAGSIRSYRAAEAGARGQNRGPKGRARGREAAHGLRAAAEQCNISDPTAGVASTKSIGPTSKGEIAALHTSRVRWSA